MGGLLAKLLKNNLIIQTRCFWKNIGGNEYCSWDWRWRNWWWGPPKVGRCYRGLWRFL